MQSMKGLSWLVLSVEASAGLSTLRPASVIAIEVKRKPAPLFSFHPAKRVIDNTKQFCFKSTAHTMRPPFILTCKNDCVITIFIKHSIRNRETLNSSLNKILPPPTDILSATSVRTDRGIKKQAGQHQIYFLQGTNIRSKTSMKKYCRYHPTVCSHWECTKCNASFCSECILERDKGGMLINEKMHLCPTCIAPAEWIAAENALEPFWKRLHHFFCYPFALFPLLLMAAISFATIFFQVRRSSPFSCRQHLPVSP